MYTKRQAMCPPGYYQLINGPRVTIYIYIYIYICTQKDRQCALPVITN